MRFAIDRMDMGVVRLVGMVLVLACLMACQRTPSEQQLRLDVDGLREAIVARDASKVASFLAEDFIGPDGMGSREARRMATGLFLRYRQVGLRTGPLAVEMHGERTATVRFTAVATGGAGAVLPDSGRMHDVQTGWRVDGGQWKLVSVNWTPTL